MCCMAAKHEVEESHVRATTILALPGSLIYSVPEDCSHYCWNVHITGFFLSLLLLLKEKKNKTLFILKPQFAAGVFIIHSAV